MKDLKKVIALLTSAAIFCASLTACGDSASDESSQAETSSSSAAVDVSASSEDTGVKDTDTQAEVSEIASLFDPAFSIEQLKDGIKKVTDGDGRELILVPKALGGIPEEYSGCTVITTPVQNAVFLSTTQACTFRTVDDSEIIGCIAGVTGGAETWGAIPPIAEAMERGDIINVGGDGMGDPDYELIQSLDPDIVFVYGGDFGQQDIMAKLDELGIKYAVDNEYLETDYLARMEWMSFLLTFFDADDAAQQVMANAKANIDSIKSDIDGLEKPTVAIFNIYGGTVYATDGASWVGSMAYDMGAENVFEGVPVINLTYETAFECISGADIIIYSGYADSMDSLADVFPQLPECRAYENDRVYRYSDDFWYGIDQSDLIAADMAAVFYPDTAEARGGGYFVHLEK